MNTVLLGISVLLGAGKNIASKAGRAFFCGFRALAQLNVLSALAAAGVLILDGGRITRPNLCVLGLAAAYAVCTFGAQALYAVAAANGSATISAQIYSFGFVLPTVFGLVWYREPFPRMALFALVLMGGSLILSTPRPAARTRQSLGAAFGAMGCSGMVGILQKVYRNSAYGDRISSFLLLSFLILAALSASAWLSARRAHPDAPRFGGRGTLLAIGIGCCTGIANRLNLLLSGTLPSIFFFPVVNGGCVLLTGLLSAVCFRERLSHRQICGIVLGIIALIFYAL